MVVDLGCRMMVDLGCRGVMVDLGCRRVLEAGRVGFCSLHPGWNNDRKESAAAGLLVGRLVGTAFQLRSIYLTCRTLTSLPM